MLGLCWVLCWVYAGLCWADQPETRTIAEDVGMLGIFRLLQKKIFSTLSFAVLREQVLSGAPVNVVNVVNVYSDLAESSNRLGAILTSCNPPHRRIFGGLTQKYRA